MTPPRRLGEGRAGSSEEGRIQRGYVYLPRQTSIMLRGQAGPTMWPGGTLPTPQSENPQIPPPAAPLPLRGAGKWRFEQLHSRYLLALIKPPFKGPREQSWCSADFRDAAWGNNPPAGRFG